MANETSDMAKCSACGNGFHPTESIRFHDGVGGVFHGGCFPGFTAKQREESLQRQVHGLIERVAALEAQRAPQPAPTPTV